MDVLGCLFIGFAIYLGWNNDPIWPQVVICGLMCFLIETVHSVKEEIKRLFAIYFNQF